MRHMLSFIFVSQNVKDENLMIFKSFISSFYFIVHLGIYSDRG